MDWQALIAVLPRLGQGLLGVFLVTGVIILVIWGLNKATERKNK